MAYAYDFEIDGLCYTISPLDNAYVSVDGLVDRNYIGSLQIPEIVTYNGNSYYVTHIESNAFQGCSGLSGTLIIPNSVKTIGDYAFQGCTGLSGSLTIPNSIEYIYSYAFANCSGFTGSLTIPNSVIHIGQFAFSGCSGFTGTLTIPSSITYIQDGTFWGCMFSGTLTIPNSVTLISAYAFRGCEKFTGTLTIPGSVTSIGEQAFLGCSGITGTLTIPSSLTYIGNSAFENCSGLTSINVEKGNTIYDSRDNCNAIIETNSNSLIAGCLNSTIPNSVGTIAQGAFAGCRGLKSITIPDNVIAIGQRAFVNCSSLMSIDISNSITSIENWTFSGCSSLSSITVPNSVITIGKGAFASSGLTTISIPQSVISIGEEVLYNCKNLRSVTLPNSLTSIGDDAFYISSVLEHVYSNIQNPFPINAYTFAGISGNAILHIPKGTKDQYYQYDNWIRFFSKILEEGEDEVPQYTLTIKAIGSGSVSYGTTSIKNTTSTFTVDEGTSISVSFSPDAGYRIKSLKVNNTAVTASTTYTATINADTSIEVEFEAIPATTYTLSIKATGNGTAAYGGTTIRGSTSSFTVNDGTSVTITIEPDTGNRIKSVKVNNSDVTSKVTNNSYTLSVTSDTTVEVEFEKISEEPDVPKTYTLSIRAKGNGIATYNGETIRATTKTYTLEEGTKFTITFTPDEGNQIKSLRVNDVYVTVSDTYEAKITADTSIKIDFEEIPVDPEPPVTYTLTIKATGNGVAGYDGETIRDNTAIFTLDEGATGTIAFTPDEGHHIKSLMVDGSAISIATSYDFTMNSDKTVEVVFEETIIETNIIVDGYNYEILSHDSHTLLLVGGDFGLTLIVPEKIEFQGEEWIVTGIDNGLLDGHEDLAAIVWNLEMPFTEKVANPNLLLYVKDESYAPASIKNVVVNGSAKSITLTEAKNGNNFYCPEAFTAQSISYTHNYLMKTGLHESRGWETIALPFDVQQFSHGSKGEIVPFAKWTSGNSAKPFWLYELGDNGFVEAEDIKANTPYIISMPNNEAYPNEYHLTGRITFSSENVTVEKSNEIQTSSFSDRSFTPNFICRDANAGYYALNVSNDYEYYQGSENEGSKFILNLRQTHPFEAYMTSSANTRSIGIFDDMTTAIKGIEILAKEESLKVYDLSGKLLRVGTSLEDMKQGLPAGVYIVNHQKIMIK